MFRLGFFKLIRNVPHEGKSLRADHEKYRTDKRSEIKGQINEALRWYTSFTGHWTLDMDIASSNKIYSYCGY